MKEIKRIWRKLSNTPRIEHGAAMIVVALLLALLTIYVSVSLTTSTTDIIASNFEVAQQRGFYTAYSKLEQMSRDFSGLFASSLNPSNESICSRVVLPDPSLLNGFRIVKPNVSCSGGNCNPSYGDKFKGGT